MPPYASLMVAVDLDPAATERVKLASSLADRFGARLVGVAGASAFAPLYHDMSPVAHARLVEDEWRRAGEALERAQALFRAAAGSRDGVEWRAAAGEPVDHLISQARAADLVVVGRPGPDDALDPRLRVPPGPLLMGLGRPVLLAPPRVERLSAARVVVAWKDTRETRRAVLDSLPLVRTAEAVFVVVVGEGEGGGEGRDGAADVAAYLARHGAASATVLRPGPGGSVADTLQRTAQREGADLVVAGAYGHSRLRQWVFGGVTRDLLGSASICCLLSR